MKNFSYFNQPISEISDQRLIDWYIAFLNGADPTSERDQEEYNEFKNEVPNRDKEFQDKIGYIDSVL